MQPESPVGPDGVTVPGYVDAQVRSVLHDDDVRRYIAHVKAKEGEKRMQEGGSALVAALGKRAIREPPRKPSTPTLQVEAKTPIAQSATSRKISVD